MPGWRSMDQATGLPPTRRAISAGRNRKPSSVAGVTSNPSRSAGASGGGQPSSLPGSAGPGGFSLFGSLDTSDTSDTDTPLGGCVRLVRVLSEACPVLSVPLFIKCPAFVRRVRAFVRGLSESVISDKPNQIATAGNGARFDCGFHRPFRHSAGAVRIIRNA